MDVRNEASEARSLGGPHETHAFTSMNPHRREAFCGCPMARDEPAGSGGLHHWREGAVFGHAVINRGRRVSPGGPKLLYLMGWAARKLSRVAKSIEMRCFRGCKESD